MYSMEKDTYTCSKCFIARHGEEAFRDMLQKSNAVLCPECHTKEGTQ